MVSWKRERWDVGPGLGDDRVKIVSASYRGCRIVLQQAGSSPHWIETVFDDQGDLIGAPSESATQLARAKAWALETVDDLARVA